VHDCAIDTPPDRPLVVDETHSYNDDLTPLASTRTYQWVHSLSASSARCSMPGSASIFYMSTRVCRGRPFRCACAAPMECGTCRSSARRAPAGKSFR